MDQDAVDDAICGRAALHLFGHKHRQRVVCHTNYIRFAAGAVNPDRQEAGWQPGYNFINVNVTGDGQSRALEIEAHLLEWQTSPERYRPVLGTDGESVVRHRIAIPGRAQVCVSTPERKCIGGPEQKSITTTSKKAPDIGGLLAFWGLSPGWRRRAPCLFAAGVIGAWSG